MPPLAVVLIIRRRPRIGTFSRATTLPSLAASHRKWQLPYLLMSLLLAGLTPVAAKAWSLTYLLLGDGLVGTIIIFLVAKSSMTSARTVVVTPWRRDRPCGSIKQSA